LFLNDWQATFKQKLLITVSIIVINTKAKAKVKHDTLAIAK